MGDIAGVPITAQGPLVVGVVGERHHRQVLQEPHAQEQVQQVLGRIPQRDQVVQAHPQQVVDSLSVAEVDLAAAAPAAEQAETVAAAETRVANLAEIEAEQAAAQTLPAMMQNRPIPMIETEKKNAIKS